ncbi:MAG: Stk1 family PASTA domain-containing Ser/Thr kinase [Acidimicrobiales bacterium]|nr:Stk1 family PASTA domain-containing Ser/Thr kinase [Acidimicrobiales bacterium]
MSDTGPTVFNGRYELHRRIGRGGMAEVSLARDQLLDRPVAVKVLFPEFATDPAFVERFRREATAAANLNHPNIVGVYDWGEAEGTYFIVMEYVDGRSLSEILRADGALHPDRVADLGADVAAALGFAHRNGVVHRDVKPGNVLVDQGGLVKVADFGIARAITATSDENLTQVGTVMGTATYFSPEQARGDAVDPRSDIYSLGCVLYELVVGRPPFSGDSPVAIAYKQVHETPVPPRQVNAAVPPALEAIILKCLAKNPVNRYPSAEDLRADLRRFREGNRILAEPVMAAPQDVGATGVMAATTVVAAAGGGAGRTRTMQVYEEEEYEEEPRRSSGAFLAVLIGLLIVLAGMLFLLARTLGLGEDEDGGPLVEVPNVEGETLESATATLRALEFEVSSTTEANDDVDAGLVFDQSPGRGERVEEGSTIDLRVSAGPDTIAVPTVVGSSVEDATNTLRTAGFQVVVEEAAEDEGEPGQVARQTPEGGAEVAEGSSVTIFVVSAPEAVEIRDVTGRPEAEASNLLGQDGFQVTSSQEASDSISEGRVIRTDPPAGSAQPEGSTVTLIVSSGPDTAAVPDVVDQTETSAISELEEAGFDVVVQDQEVLDPARYDRVLDQNPNGGTDQAPGSVVTIVVGREVVVDGGGGGGD